MKLTLGFSPCPNDTFIFDALVNNKIDTGGLSFDVMLEDVETLNQWALKGKLDITKISYAVLPLVTDQYIVLNSGSALGRGVGPLLISNNPQGPTGEQARPDDLVGRGILNVEAETIAIPGEHTTAHLLFSLAYPAAKNKIFIRYDQIEDFVLEGRGLGVIIHENRFTYEAKGLQKITDLGNYWEKETGNPIPLGGIVVRRGLNTEIQQQVDGLVRKSIEYAYSNYPALNDYIRKHSQEMSEEVMRKHIELYVNDFSLDLGDAGKAAVQGLLNIHQNTSNHKSFLRNEIFLNPAKS